MTASGRSQRGDPTRTSAKRSRPKKVGTLYQVLVTLDVTRPEVWRRILVPADLTLGQLHHLIQAAMGWEDRHQHAFRVCGQQYGDPKSDIEGVDDGTVGDENLLTLESATLQGMQMIEYEYDPGDAWRHTIRVEKEYTARAVTRGAPSCIAGVGACPPEDVGGAPGYEAFLWAIAHPNHRDHERNLAWVGGVFDPDRFDLVAANRRVRSARR